MCYINLRTTVNLKSSVVQFSEYIAVAAVVPQIPHRAFVGNIPDFRVHRFVRVTPRGDGMVAVRESVDKAENITCVRKCKLFARLRLYSSLRPFRSAKQIINAIADIYVMKNFAAKLHYLVTYLYTVSQKKQDT